MNVYQSAIGVAVFTTAVTAAGTTVVGFDGGSNGGFTGNAVFEASGGNPGGAARHITDLFFNDLRTGGLGEPANQNFLGDYSSFTDIEFSVDVKTNMLDDFIGNPIARSVGIMLIDRDIQGPDGASGVFFELGLLGVNFTPDWTTLSVTIADPTVSGLPAGWIGFGDTDPNTFEPILPPGATFASVLAGVDEFRVTGAVPGFFYTNAFWDVQVDNISVTVPAPGTALLICAGLFAARSRRR
ncbi:MAG: hypothetical protein KDA21_02245 [Phycisphaerales bacterium]|nr:hypothetical protein [Phycisphaerales bacterium]